MPKRKNISININTVVNKYEIVIVCFNVSFIIKFVFLINNKKQTKRPIIFAIIFTPSKKLVVHIKLISVKEINKPKSFSQDSRFFKSLKQFFWKNIVAKEGITNSIHRETGTHCQWKKYNSKNFK